LLARSGVDSSQVTRQDAIAVRTMSRRGARPAAVPKRTGMAWSEVETLSNIGPGGSSALLLSGRFSGSGVDDLAVLNQGQYVQIAHPSRVVDGMRKTTAQVTVDSTGSVATSALPARITPDGRLGVLTASSGAQPLTVTPPTSTYRTYNVNTTADATPNSTSEQACVTNGSGCTLRAAIYLANEDYNTTTTGTSTIDTINVPAGTYTLSANNGSTLDDQGSVNIHLDLDASMNLVGAGSASTIINGNGSDKVFSVDSGVVRGNGSNGDYAIDPIDVFLSGMTIENGTNTNNPNNATCTECDYFGGNMDWESDGTGNLTMNNVVVTNGKVLYEGGGGIFTSNSASGTGTFELDNSTVSNNKTPELGGGLYIGFNNPMVLANDIFTGNVAQPSVNTGDADSDGIGGAIATNENQTAKQDTISNCTFNTNTATLEGGAVDLANGFSMTSSTFTGNSTSANGYGAGMHFVSLDTTATITNSTFTGNTVQTTGSGDGAGICVELGGSSTSQTTDILNLHYSRIHGNTGPSNTNTGVGIGCQTTPITNAAAYATLNATDNWWGCNTAPTTKGTACDFVGQTTTGPDEIVSETVSPLTQLKISLSSTTPAGGATLTATGTLNSDSNGSTFSTANDAAYSGVPATLAIVQHDGTTANSTASALNSTGTIATSTTATAAGSGTATVTVDGFAVFAPFSVTAPDLTVTSTHTGNFKAGDTADAYILTATNGGSASTSGTVTVVDSPPSGFTATALTGTGWSCTLSSLTCTRSDALAASASYPAITLTVGVSSSDAGTYTNTATVSGGGETNTSNDTGTDSTIVVAAPTISEAFNPTSVAPNANSTVTFTLGNPGANSISLTGVAFSDTLPTGLRVSSPSGAATNCNGGTVSAAAGGGSISLSGGTIASGATCTVTVNVNAPSIGSYTNTTGTVTATNSNAGSTASATLMVTVTPTKLVYTSVPPSPLTAGGNAGTVSVALEDGAGNVATNNSTTMVTLAVTGPSGYSQTYPPATVTNGVAMFNLSSVPLTVAGTYTYTASATSLTSAVATEVVNPGAAAAFTVTGLGTFMAPGMAGSAMVTARDTYGNIATGFTGTVTLTSSDPQATLPAAYTYQASDAGVHGFSVTLNTAGTQSVTATSSAVTGSEVGIVVEDAIWLINTNGTLDRLTDAGIQTGTAGSASGTSTYAAIAFDNTGGVWAVDNATSSVFEFNHLGTAITVSGASAAGVNTPAALAIDGVGQVWVADGNNRISVLSSAGTAVTPSTGYQGGSISTPTGISIDSSGSVWVTNSGNNSVTKIIGGAAPVVTPTVTGTTTNTLGTRPQ
jgi:CSLREA domain-containing protein